MFARWHAEPGVRPFLLTIAGQTAGFGELWEDPDEDDAELARLIVDPARRGRGVGRLLATLLLAEARRLGWSTIWLRVAPDNAPALRAYTSGGFVRASREEEACFNIGQPAAYVWMRAPSSQG